MKVLILFGHPAFQKSQANKLLVDDINSIHQVTFHDLYERYPDLDIDIDYEQELLKKHDCIIFQHPLFWYSTPAIFKEWMDLVLEHGFAFGKKGNALKGKLFFSAITTGARRDSFRSEGDVHYTINQLLAPIFQTGNLCKMNVLPPFVTYGTMYMSLDEILLQKKKFKMLLNELVSDTFDINKAKQNECLTDYIKLS